MATQGAGHLDAERLRHLLAPLAPTFLPFERARKLRSCAGLLRAAFTRRPDLIVMEGTGMAGGLALLMANALLGVPYVVSSGDAVGPYLRLRSRPAGLLGAVYERLLCRRCAGFIGWSPYLVGRALTFGAPRGITAAGWSRTAPTAGARARVRGRLGVPEDVLLVGLVGSLNWRAQVSYAYGAELVRAVRRLARRDVVALVVGDGPGRAHLEEMAGEDLGSRILLPGRVPAEEVADHLAALDLASLPQSVDGVGSFRYTTKLSEYLAASLPIVTGQIPAAYDLDNGCLWRLPGKAPWSQRYVDSLVDLLEGLDREELARRRDAAARHPGEPFDAAAQQRRACAFVREILAERR